MLAVGLEMNGVACPCAIIIEPQEVGGVPASDVLVHEERNHLAEEATEISCGVRERHPECGILCVKHMRASFANLFVDFRSQGICPIFTGIAPRSFVCLLAMGISDLDELRSVIQRNTTKDSESVAVVKAIGVRACIRGARRPHSHDVAVLRGIHDRFPGDILACP